MATDVSKARFGPDVIEAARRIVDWHEDHAVKRGGSVSMIVAYPMKADLLVARALLDAGEGDKENTCLSGRDDGSDERHTATSWTSERQDGNGGDANAGDDVYSDIYWAIHDAATYAFIANVYSNDAHARLIGAAPDLLEALKDLLADCREYVCINNLAGTDGQPATNHAMRRADTAISKATKPDAPRPEGASNPSPKGKEDDEVLAALGGNTRPDGAQ